jgi:hypothetical protein
MYVHSFMYCSHFWILRRISVYIVLLFYLMYYGLIAVCGPKAGYTMPHIRFLYVLLALRFLAFSLETLVDVAIDMQIHNDLISLTSPLPDDRDGEGTKYLDIRNSFTSFPFVIGSNCYEGSLNSWTPFSIQHTTKDLSEHVTNSKTHFSNFAMYGGCLLQFAITGFFAFLLGIIVFTAVIAVVFVGLVTDIVAGRKSNGGYTFYVREIFYNST